MTFYVTDTAAARARSQAGEALGAADLDGGGDNGRVWRGAISRPAVPRAGTVQRPTDIPAVLAWDAVAPNELLPAMLRSWEDLFGSRVVAFEGATLQRTSGCRTSKSTPDLLVSVSTPGMRVQAKADSPSKALASSNSWSVAASKVAYGGTFLVWLPRGTRQRDCECEVTLLRQQSYGEPS
jgi:hypothetical protein